MAKLNDFQELPATHQDSHTFTYLLRHVQDEHVGVGSQNRPVLCLPFYLSGVLYCDTVVYAAWEKHLLTD